MSLIADGLLIATCLTTALYCLVLSRRLRRLSDTDEGIGQQILRLNTALAETRATVSEIRSTAKAASDQLEQDIESARHQSNQLQRQIARALKSGVGSGRTAAPPVPERLGDHARDDGTSRSQPRSMPEDVNQAPGGAAEDSSAARIVDFDAVEAAEDDLDEDLRAGDAVAAAGWPETTGPPDAAVEDETHAAHAETSESEGAWPFRSDDPDTEEVPVPETSPAGAEIDPEDPAEQPGMRGRRGGRRRGSGGEEGEAGLLRVERMAV